MRSWLRDFFTPSITVRSYSITGFTLVLMRRVSVFWALLWGKVLQNPPVLPALPPAALPPAVPLCLPRCPAAFLPCLPPETLPPAAMLCRLPAVLPYIAARYGLPPAVSLPLCLPAVKA